MTSNALCHNYQWKPSCKTGTAKWVYDGVCSDPLVFGTLLGLGGPPNFKMHKMPVADFDNLFGQIQASVRSVPQSAFALFLTWLLTGTTTCLSPGRMSIFAGLTVENSSSVERMASSDGSSFDQ